MGGGLRRGRKIAEMEDAARIRRCTSAAGRGDVIDMTREKTWPG